MQQKPLNWGAIIAGWAVKAFVGGFLVGILTAISVASGTMGMIGQLSRLPKGTQPTPQQMQNMTAQMGHNLFSPTLLIAIVLIGTLFLILGGFIAGKIAGHSEVRHAMFVGIISCVISLVTSLPSLFVASRGTGFSTPIAATLAPIVLAIPMAMLGGMLAEMMRKPETAAPTQNAFDPIPRI